MESKKNIDLTCDTKVGTCTPKDATSTKLKTSKNETSKIKLIYYYDALCGWCYGFSPVMSKVKQEYGDKIDIEVVSGGLFLGSQAGYINNVAPHIKSGAYKSVEARTGVKFGDVFLKDVFGDGKITLNSLPPSIALCIVKEQQPENELTFAAMLLDAVYFDGLNPIDLDGLANYAEKIGFNKEEFRLKLEDDKYKIAAEKEFQLYRNSGSRGMPTLVIEKDNQQNLLSNGYTTFEELKLKLEPFLIDQ